MSLDHSENVDPVEGTKYKCINNICQEAFGEHFNENGLKQHMRDIHKKPITHNCEQERRLQANFC